MITALDATDKLIADLESAFTILSQKLIGVQDDIQYRAITGTGGFNDPQLTGDTKRTVEHAQSLIGGLWVLSNLVGQRLQEVRTKRAAVKTGFFSGGGAGKELEDLLKLHNLTVNEATSDKLPSELRQAIFTEKPGFTSVEVVLQIAPDQLKVGAKSIIEVNECMAALKAQIDDTEVKLTQVLPIVTKIGGAAKLAHGNAVTNVASAKLAYEHDPLGVRKGFEQTIGQHVATINKALDGVQRAKEKAYADLSDARVLMQRLEDKQPTPARTPELKDWLAKLAARVDQEEWATASAGLDDWIKEASGVLAIQKPPSSYQPPAQKPVVPPPTLPHVQTDGRPAHTAPPAHTQHTPAPAPYVNQVPTAADYHRYAPAEKSNLEKLLDGELSTGSTAAPATVSKPVDPEVEKLVAAQTPPSGAPTATTAPSSAIDALVNGPGKQQPAATQSPAGPSNPSPGQSNAAIDALVNGPGKTTKGNTSPGTSTPPPSGDGRTNSSIEDLISGKPAAKPPVTPAKPAGTEVASSHSDSSKLTELFDEKKKPQPAPTTVQTKDVTPAAKAPATNAKPAPTLSQAEQDAAQRKALEDLLKG